MLGQLDAAGAALRSPFPWIAFSAGLALTAAAWLAVERNRYDDARQQFERRVENAVTSLRARITVYEQVLRSGAAGIASNPNITRDEWRRFISFQQLSERFPGFQSIGYAEYVNRSNAAEHLKRMKAEIPDYEIRPPGDRDERVVIVYNEPYVGRNMRVVGFDMYAEETRRAALDRARLTGETAITGRVTLAGEAFRGDQPSQHGFLMYVPFFHDGAASLPRGDRRNAVVGFVFAPFRMNDLIQTLLDQGMLRFVDMRIYDEAVGGTQAEMIDTRAVWRSSTVAGSARFERILHFPMPGRAWTIHFASRPDYDAALIAERPWVILASGIMGSVVVLMLTAALVEAWSRAHMLSMRDPLTGLHNRRYHDETMPRELARSRRAGQNVGVIAIDIDHFKRLNDTYGHDLGDHVLSQVGELLRAAGRAGDIACRFGGEEFALILPGATLEVARNRAESIRAAFASMKFMYEGKEIGPFSLSAGVTSMPPTMQDWAAVLRQADRALYAAKQGGRNKVMSTEEI